MTLEQRCRALVRELERLAHANRVNIKSADHEAAGRLFASITTLRWCARKLEAILPKRPKKRRKALAKRLDELEKFEQQSRKSMAKDKTPVKQKRRKVKP